MGVKIDLDNFEYNSKYELPNEHRWDFMKDSDKEKEYFIEREKIGKPKKKWRALASALLTMTKWQSAMTPKSWSTAITRCPMGKPFITFPILRWVCGSTRRSSDEGIYGQGFSPDQ